MAQSVAEKKPAISCAAAGWLAAAAFLIVLALFIGHWRQLQTEGLLARFALVSDYVVTVPQVVPGTEDLSMLRRVLENAGIGITTEESEISLALQIQHWLGNQVSRVEVPSPGNTTGELLPQIQAGSGLSCWGMATVYQDLITVLGLPVRRVQLYRSNFEPMDSHVLVEVQIAQGRWAAFDPTFNLSFQDQHGAPLGVAAIRARLAGRDSGQVIPVYHGDRRYPARIDEYYLDWRVLFANAYVADKCTDCSLLERLPPFRYWYGPVRYAFGQDLGSLARQHNRFYFTAVVIYPLLLCALMLVFLSLGYRYCRN